MLPQKGMTGRKYLGTALSAPVDSGSEAGVTGNKNGRSDPAWARGAKGVFRPAWAHGAAGNGGKLVSGKV